MAIKLQPIQLQKRQVPSDLIMQALGSGPGPAIAQAGASLGDALAERIKKKKEIERGAMLAKAAGLDMPPGAETLPDDVKALAPYAKNKETEQANRREEARKNAELQLKVLEARNGWVSTDPTTGVTKSYPGMSGVTFDDGAGNGGMPRLLVEDFHPGPKPVGGGGSGNNGTGLKDPLSKLQEDLDPSNVKSGMAKQAARSQAADRVLTLMSQSGGDPNVLQAPEAAMAVASLVQGGNSGRIPIEQLNHLTPNSLWGDMQKQLSYLSNQPRSLGQAEFFKSLTDTAMREKATVESQIKATQTSRLGRHEQTRRLFPDAYSAILANYGLDAKKVQGGRYIDTPARLDGAETPEARKARLITELKASKKQ